MYNLFFIFLFSTERVLDNLQFNKLLIFSLLLSFLIGLCFFASWLATMLAEHTCPY